MTSANLPQSNTRNIGNGVQIGKKSIQRRRAESGKPLREGLSQSSRPLFFRASSALFCITLLFSLFFLFSSDQAAAQTGDSSPIVRLDSNHQTISPVLSNLDDIIALIEELIRILKEAKRKIEEGPDGKRDDPLVFPQPLSVLWMAPRPKSTNFSNLSKTRISHRLMPVLWNALPHPQHLLTTQL